MGQKVNTTGLRKGVINFWNNRWYVDNDKYNSNFFIKYQLNLYITFILKKLKITVERCEINKLNNKLFIKLFFYHTFFKMKKKKKILRFFKRLRRFLNKKKKDKKKKEFLV